MQSRTEELGLGAGNEKPETGEISVVSPLEPLGNERMLVHSDPLAFVGRAILETVHDFNNIFYTIGCISDVLMLEQPDGNKSRTDLEEIKKAAHRGAALARQLDSQVLVHLRRAAHATTEGAAQEDPADGQPQAATVLVVGNEDAARNATRRILQSEGYHVVEASCVQQALDVSSGCPQAIDLLFTDVILPDGDGVTLCRKLRKLQPRLRVLFVSGDGCDVLARHQMPEHEYHFIEKPCRRAKVVETVRQALSSSC